MSKKMKRLLLILFGALLCFILLMLVYLLGYIPKRVYYAEDFQIDVIYSLHDENQNGIDDYTDIMLGARKDAMNKPKYVADSYTIGGYPADDIGVCTDVIWRAFKNAGYSLKEMVDQDIAQNTHLYPATNGVPDPNIDFRRVRNLKVFFDRHAKILTNNIDKISEWQPGDIVIFGKNYSHIGIISDKRNRKGIPYLIHNSGQPNREEDILEILILFEPITGHYRFEKEISL